MILKGSTNHAKFLHNPPQRGGFLVPMPGVSAPLPDEYEGLLSTSNKSPDTMCSLQEPHPSEPMGSWLQ